ncbi:hypothetical protein FH5_04273 [Priestia endophytica]|nr:hypothetical protein FH5_04273 [Priestia endophytica]
MKDCLKHGLIYTLCTVWIEYRQYTKNEREKACLGDEQAFSFLID